MNTAPTQPFAAFENRNIFQRGHWPASWITLPEAIVPPYVLGFRLVVELPERTQTRFFITADERYELHLDGKLIARGPERGSANAWYYETLDLNLPAGRHVLFARVWALGKGAPLAQFTVLPGFLVAVEKDDGSADPTWSTGHAPWQVKKLEGYRWVENDGTGVAGFTGARIILDGERYPWGAELGEGPDWVDAKINSAASVAHPTDLNPLRLLVPGTLPPMLRRDVRAGKVRFLEEVSREDDLPQRRVNVQNHLPDQAARLQEVLDQTAPWTVPAGKRYRAIIDLENYYCAYPHLVVSGGKGARLALEWAEALFEKTLEEAWDGLKGHRDRIEGYRFVGYPDVFIFDGEESRHYSTLWWNAGRYLQIVIETSGEELVLNSFSLEETRYPLEMKSTLSTSDPRHAELLPLLLRTLQMNAHETFMDCPYYEQLNYTGDTLIDCLVVYTISDDLRLVRKSLQLFNDSRLPEGLSQSRFPARWRQFIPPFSLLWISMVRNHALWRGEPEFIRTLLPGVRAVIDAHLGHLNSDGLLEGLNAWNFLDWVPAWDGGIPPDGDAGKVSGPQNWLLIYALQAALELEMYAGEKELADRYSRLIRGQTLAVETAFWNEPRGLYADDLKHQSFSEHAQCLALLTGSGRADRAERAAQGLIAASDLHRCTIYFTHYLFETFQKLRLAEPFFQRLEHWLGLRSQGFVTVLEKPEPSRSDCHAWGSHPLHHFYSTVLGIRPAGMGFKEVTIAPLLGPLEKISGKMIHPKGWIEVDLRQKGSVIEGTVTVPKGVSGRLFANGREQRLTEGSQRIVDG